MDTDRRITTGEPSLFSGHEEDDAPHTDATNSGTEGTNMMGSACMDRESSQHPSEERKRKSR